MYIKTRALLRAEQCLLRKMRILVSFLLLAISCSSSVSISVQNRDNSRLLANYRNDAEFFQGIGTWFGNLKSQFCEKWISTTTTISPPPIPSDVLDLDKLQLQKRLRNRNWLQVNLSTLSFDPERDWGYRIGNWYFIRKGNKKNNEFVGNNSGESNSQTQDAAQSKDSSEGQTETYSRYTRHPDTTEFPSITDTSITLNNKQSITQERTTQSLSESTTDTDSIVSSSTTKEIEVEDKFSRGGSVEVLMG